jgi:hypothetical protein
VEIQIMKQKLNTRDLGDTVPTDKPKTDGEIFLEFHCPELKDLGKHFLTVISAVLAFSVTFSEKITEIPKATLPQKVLLMCSWLFLIIAVVASGAGLYFNFAAGAQAHGAIIRGGKTDFKIFVRRTYRLYEIAGGSFIMGLVLLAADGVSKLLNK